MSLPSTAWLACACLLWAAATSAQSRAPREKKERQASLLRGPTVPAPQVRVAAGVLSSLFFNAPLASAQLEGRERFTRLDVGERALYLEPALELAPTERLALHLVFADGREAVILLIPHPSEVDTRVDFALPERSADACEHELATTLARCEAQSQELKELQSQRSPGALALAGSFDQWILRTYLPKSDSPGPLTLVRGRTYRLRGWVVLTLSVRNTSAAPWTPTLAFLTPAAPGVRVWMVFPANAAVAPGAEAEIAIELKLPAPGKLREPGAKHDLTLCDSARERCLSFPSPELE
ncbi:DUF2381 family protein [Hyalangium versicolor]|uniref:DUF2381 family protein n=1 Tax=Hyalangium versicolor TaxID=2861190 RepID=UPI001CCC1AA5|nr:DUF2381 family protein [Hyalangium versicolor]